ncbi:MAG: hypothetical protein APU95_02375 [Hadesarchaea archaeon YNP_N21]|nr:MAG: hypothetical protein APU95_02375 [Hadesarchaea archaeon YNP_N21]
MNRDLINARIREANDAIKVLRELVAKDFGALTDPEKFSIRYLLIQLVEATASICLHILSRIHGEEVEGYPDSFLRLGAKRIIPKDLATKLASAARLRNLLVHRYWEIIDEKVYASVKQGLKDFEEFIDRINTFCKGEERWTR